ncbi:ExbD/TolR family protein [Algimonas porphyrae]|uniref:Biopolymer transporter ExbD n=1 Tax=Algimonas porphyrae TaxID=1128113 RepID=A0ABQ5V0Z2_9PROT|nr:biopolymer transporter ExbD [Algimonas porphyrae]GLQ19897.1 biopolymer transporter ExbD [Algimonas porphyrae]
MARRSRTVIEDEGTELNMTPMLDVVFILLIFFIVTSVFVKTPGLEPFKPEATTDVEWNPTILVAVDSSSNVWIDKRPYRIEEIRPILTALRDETPKANAIIQADRNADVGTVMGVQELFQDLGVETRVGTE